MEENPPIVYSRLSRRLKALMLDVIVLSLSLYAIILLLIQSGIENPYIANSFVIILAFSIEPLFVTFTGASIGHHICGIKVRRAGCDKNLNLFFSCLRFFVKLPLGIASLLPVLSTRQHQALHDMASQSIVVLKHPQNFPAWEQESERTLDRENYIYPSKIRRTVVIVTYLVTAIILVGIAMTLSLSGPCLQSGLCSNIDSTKELAISILFWIALFVVIGFGTRGQLFGCRRRLRDA